ncbi:hypothetical protein QE367_003141 [Microbacterium paludicola]|uniref:Uncharacterized protein n=1 Tax=Microbacterium paludicola TaxID=300019 RepID=A0ABU1I4X2_9MICO|nr:hypothetical protein [Microbacterium paludicola]MDR6168937.1 hypothetical protein [Microbacterium paludicola]
MMLTVVLVLGHPHVGVGDDRTERLGSEGGGLVAVGFPDASVEARERRGTQVGHAGRVGAGREHLDVGGAPQIVAELEAGVDGGGGARSDSDARRGAGELGHHDDGRHDRRHREACCEHGTRAWQAAPWFGLAALSRLGGAGGCGRSGQRTLARAGLGPDEQEHRGREDDERDQVDGRRHRQCGNQPYRDEGDGRQQRHPCRDDGVVEQDRESCDRRHGEDRERAVRSEGRDSVDDLPARAGDEGRHLGEGSGGRDDEEQRGVAEVDGGDECTRRHQLGEGDHDGGRVQPPQSDADEQQGGRHGDRDDEPRAGGDHAQQREDRGDDREEEDGRQGRVAGAAQLGSRGHRRTMPPPARRISTRHERSPVRSRLASSR